MSEGTQRRLAAIVSADVVGYSRLIGQDEEGTLAALRAHRAELIDPLIAEHGGRVVKTMGDGLLLEFPSVVGAVKCSIAVQRGMAASNNTVDEARRLTFRIGVNLGDIAIDGDDIHGDGVNVAARLQEACEPGGLALSGVAHESLGSLVDARFSDGGRRQFKNIAREIQVWRWALEAHSGALADDEPPALPDKPSIAVLPFDNMSGDPEQEYFADGIAEDVITALSRFRSLFVIARNSSFTYKGRAVDVTLVAHELGVRYVVEGSVRKAGNRVRITAQLNDAATSNHLWADRFDRDLDDIFAVQDEVTLAIVTAIEPTLASAERDRALRKPPNNLDAWEAYQRGLWHLYQSTKMENSESIAYFQRAIERDPNFASGYAGLASALYMSATLGFRDDAGADILAAGEAAQRALALDPDDALVHDMAGWTHQEKWRRPTPFALLLPRI